MAKINGVAGIWSDEKSTLKAATYIRKKGFRKFDAITPYPVHGMEQAIDIKRSWIPWVTLVGGIAGLSFGLFFTWWTSAVDWPINIGGKPYFSLPAFIPIIFELTILFGALLSIGSLFFACRLPKVNPPIIDPDLTSHKFAIFIPNTDEGYEEDRVRELLKETGAEEIKKIEGY